MSNYEKVRVNLTNIQLIQLKSAVKNQSRATLNNKEKILIQRVIS